MEPGGLVVPSLLSLLGRSNNSAKLKKELCDALDSLAKQTKKDEPSITVFADFVVSIHDYLIQSEYSVKAELFRIIRYGLSTKEHCRYLISQEIDWILIDLFERDQESVAERMQALKIMKVFMKLDACSFPISFARSLVAVAGETGDNFRRVSLDTLRELSLVNTFLVAKVDGFRVLKEAVLDPSLQDASESILLSILYLLNNASTRVQLRPALNLRGLISPFTNLDSEISDVLPRLHAAKSAFITTMRSWVGIILLTSDPLGLTVFVNLLKDSKVSSVIQSMIVECITELFSTLLSKAATSKAQLSGRRNEAYGNVMPNNMKTANANGSNGNSQVDGSWNVFGGRNGAPTQTNRTSLSDRDDMPPMLPKENKHFSFSTLLSSGVSRFSSTTQNTTTPVAQKRPSRTKDTIFPLPSGVPIAATARFYEEEIGESNDGVVFNMLDSYAAILCCSFIHAGVVDSLCYLGTRGEAGLAAEARKLLVDIISVVVTIFPDSMCATLIEIPFLVEFASTLSNSSAITNRSLKASQILTSLASHFSVLTVSSAAPINIAEDKFGRVGHLSSSPNSTVSSPNSNNGSNGTVLGGTAVQHTILSVVSDLKLYCKPRADGLLFSCRGHGTRSDLMYDLRHAITNAIDRNEFSRQVELSKVIGKEGKEPFRWDWVLIDDMLEYSFKNVERLPEALKTKWVKRVSGFYRCCVEEKAYFVHLEWEPSNMLYMECACNMYHVLVGHEGGVSFLSSDRRGMLFNEMARDLEQLVSTPARAWVQGAMVNKNVFRAAGCTQSMSREYFTLLGRLTTTAAGRSVLDTTQVSYHLSMVGHQQALDYISRLALTALAFTDDGHYSKDLLQIYTTSGSCSTELRYYIHTLLRVLFRKPQTSSYAAWGVDIMIAQMQFLPTCSLTKVLEEVSMDIKHLKSIVVRRPNFIGKPNTENLMIRMTALPDGIALLKEQNWFDDTLKRWDESGCQEYLSKVEKNFAKSIALMSARIQGPTVPILLNAPNLAFANGNRSAGASTTTASSHPNNTATALNYGLDVDLEGLLRMPWNMEVKLSNSHDHRANVNTNINTWEYMRVDTFLDASELVSTSCGEISSDHLRLVKVRGLILDNAGLPTGFPVAATRMIATSLLCGSCPVHRNGDILTPKDARHANSKEKRKATVNAMKMESEKMGSGPPSNRRPSMMMGTEGSGQEADLPITFQFEHLQDWSYCRPSNRLSKTSPLPNDRFLVEIPGEPVSFVFSRSLPKTLRKSATTSFHTDASGAVSVPSDDGSGSVSPGSASAFTAAKSNTVYLVEVHYHIRLKTNQAMFVPVPRHLYGEMARNKEGCQILLSQGIISSLLEELNGTSKPASDANGNVRVGNDRSRAALWALGHIGSTHLGFTLLLSLEPVFVKILVNIVTTSSNLSMRGTAYFVLGLVSRSRGGAQLLVQEEWDASPLPGIAVAIPRNVPSLFNLVDDEGAGEEIDIDSPYEPPACARHLRPMQIPVQTPVSEASSRRNTDSPVPLSHLSLNVPSTDSMDMDIYSEIDRDILNSISKLPGHIMYKESFAHLKELRSRYPTAFHSRPLLRAVHELLSSYTFKLPVRRALLELFPLQSKMKSAVLHCVSP